MSQETVSGPDDLITELKDGRLLMQLCVALCGASFIIPRTTSNRFQRVENISRVFFFLRQEVSIMAGEKIPRKNHSTWFPPSPTTTLSIFHTHVRFRKRSSRWHNNDNILYTQFGADLSDIAAEDIVEGRVQPTLRVIWCIVLAHHSRFESTALKVNPLI